MDKRGLWVDSELLYDLYDKSNYKERSNLVYRKLAHYSLKDLTNDEKEIIDAYFWRYKKKKFILDPTYIQCLTEKDKYNYFIKEDTKKKYKDFYSTANEKANDLKEAYKYAKASCDMAVLNNPIEKKLYKNGVKYIIKGRRKLSVADTKIISRYYLFNECQKRGLFLNLDEITFTFDCFWHPFLFDSFKEYKKTYKEHKEKQKNEFGSYSGKEIVVNYSLINKKKKDERLYHLLVTIFHEARHAYQDKIIREKDRYDFKTLLMCKELIVTHLNEKYYHDYYGYLLFELDAETYGIERSLDIMKKDFNKYYDGIKDKAKLKMDDNLKRMNRFYNEYFYYNYYEDGDRLEREFLKYFNKNTAKKMLEIYPILNLQYNEDGSYKNKRTLEKEYNDYLKKGITRDILDTTYGNLYWQYVKSEINVNGFYETFNKRVDKTKKK